MMRPHRPVLTDYVLLDFDAEKILLHDDLLRCQLKFDELKEGRCLAVVKVANPKHFHWPNPDPEPAPAKKSAKTTPKKGGAGGA